MRDDGIVYDEDSPDIALAIKAGTMRAIERTLARQAPEAMKGVGFASLIREDRDR